MVKGMGKTEIPRCSASAWEMPLLLSVTMAIRFMMRGPFPVAVAGSNAKNCLELRQVLGCQLMDEFPNSLLVLFAAQTIQRNDRLFLWAKLSQ